MKDPFGTATSMIVLSADRAETSVKKEVKGDKKVNLTDIYVAGVKPLNQAKDALKEIAENIDDPTIKAKVNGFAMSVVDIICDILELTKGEVRGAEQIQATAPQQTTAPAPAPQQQKITPEMISG